MIASFFTHIKDTTPRSRLAVDDFLRKVREGEWQDKIIALRRETDPQRQKQLKQALPLVTLSGTFTKRGVANLVEHSGFIGMDIDEIDDIDRLEKQLRLDPYVYAFFRSCRGKGLCVLFKIDPRKHHESFLGLQEYFWTKYEQPVDPSGKDVSRARFVSYDPDLYVNTDSQLFKQYPKPKPRKHKIKEMPYADSDIYYVIGQINKRALDITGGYNQWLQIGFAFVSKFGESGRELYHQVSQHSALYDPKKTDKQYDHCLRHGAQQITISTFFYYAKLAGCNIVSEETKRAAVFLSQQKRNHAEKSGAIKALLQHGKVNEDTARQIADQVYEEGVQINTKEQGITDLEQVEMFLQQFNFRYNQITQFPEYPDGRVVDDRELNNLWRKICGVLRHEKFTVGKIKQILTSDFCPSFNPLRDFFDQLPTTGSRENIKRLIQCIPTDTGLDGDNFLPHLVEKFITKWLVGIVASAYGTHSPLMLVLMGAQQGTGKTYFLRNFLPEPLKRYYAETKFSEGKDDLILMCRKLVLMLDEFSGKMLRDEKAMKDVLSKQIFTLRAPYGTVAVDQPRLAVLCATANETAILNDPTGNRRFICINVTGPIDQELFNSIDKTALFAEVKSLYEAGYHHEILGDEIRELNQLNNSYYDTPLEGELFQKYFAAPADFPGAMEEKLTLADIWQYIRVRAQANLNKRILAAEIKRLGYESKATSFSSAGVVRRGKFYSLVKTEELHPQSGYNPTPPRDF